MVLIGETLLQFPAHVAGTYVQNVGPIPSATTEKQQQTQEVRTRCVKITFDIPERPFSTWVAGCVTYRERYMCLWATCLQSKVI